MARLVAERVDDKGLARLTAVVQDGRRAVHAGDHLGCGTVNTVFHDAAAPVGRRLAARRPGTGDRSAALAVPPDDRPRAVQSEHEQLHAALLARDAELAGAVALAHVRASRHMVLEGMPGSAGGTTRAHPRRNVSTTASMTGAITDLVRQGLRKSKVGAYAAPRAETVVGWPLPVSADRGTSHR